MVGLATNHRPTLLSHKSMMGIFLNRMLHEKVKFQFYLIEAHYIIENFFCFCGIAHEFLGTNIAYQTVANGPLSAKFAPPGSNL